MIASIDPFATLAMRRDNGFDEGFGLDQGTL